MNRLLARSIQDIALDDIIVSKANAREFYDEGELGSLQDSIGRMGQIYPVVLRRINDTKYELIIGTRRLRVARRQKLETIPAFVIESLSDKDIVILALAENLHRSDLTPFEEAKAMLKLCKEYGMDTDDVAKHIGKPVEFVCGRLRILSLPDKVQKMLCEGGGLNFSHVKMLATLKKPRDQIRYAKLVAQQKLSGPDLVTLIEDDVVAKSKANETGRRLFTPKATALKIKRFEKFLSKNVRPRLTLGGKETREIRVALRKVRKTIKELLGHSMPVQG